MQIVRRPVAAMLLLACCIRFSVGIPSVLTGKDGTPEDILVEFGVVEAVEELCSRRVTAVRYAEALLQRAAKHRCINAYAHVENYQVLKEARAIDERFEAGEDIRPLCGLAFVVKDNLDVLGYPTEAGTPALRGRMPCNSSALVARLLNANGIVLGKTRMHELAMGATTINPNGGPVLNPHNNLMHVGGSSGGTAASVAMRLAPAGFCSDSAGSCRIPASLTGVVGFRPTTGYWNAADGIVPMSVTRDTVGVNARTVSDVKLLNNIFSDGPKEYKDVDVSTLRLGYPVNFWRDVGDETKAAFAAAVDALRGAGVEIVEMDMSLLESLADEFTPGMMFFTYEMPREISRYVYQHGYNLSMPELVDKIASPTVKASMTEWTYKKLDSFPTPTDYANALASGLPQLKALWESYHDAFGLDALLVPATIATARPISDVEPYMSVNGKKGNFLSVYIRTTLIDCTIGVPGLSIPVGLAADKLPIGIMLQGKPGSDASILSIGEALQPLFASTPAPSEEQACAGCMPGVKVVNVTWDGQGQPSKTDTTSQYELTLSGKCKLQSLSHLS
ncbi:g7172 [Coccomyxa viridis]|uniref:G7172 protein n=1 Tax=Coccomyxa viridis TaxID=1274662 RepID=A0ABP1FZQ9_9CHLO